MVRAKFYVSSVSKQKMGQQGSIGSIIKLNPVISGSAENEKFYQYTPSGSIEIGTINEEAAASFEIGKEFYVDFNSAD